MKTGHWLIIFCMAVVLYLISVVPPKGVDTVEDTSEIITKDEALLLHGKVNTALTNIALLDGNITEAAKRQNSRIVELENYTTLLETRILSLEGTVKELREKEISK